MHVASEMDVNTLSIFENTIMIMIIMITNGVKLLIYMFVVLLTLTWIMWVEMSWYIKHVEVNFMRAFLEMDINIVRYNTDLTIVQMIHVVRLTLIGL